MISVASADPNLQRPAADRLTAQPGEHQQAGRLGVLGDVAVATERRIESGVEPDVELGVVRLDAEPRIVAARILDGDLDHAHRQQPLDGGCRLQQLPPSGFVERIEQGACQLVTEPVELGGLRLTGGGAPRDPPATVIVGRRHRDQTITFEIAQQSTQVAGVETQPRPQRAHVAAVGPDLPQQRARRRAVDRATGTPRRGRRSAP